MKKILSILLSVLMLLSLCGCHVANELDEEVLSEIISELDDLSEETDDWDYDEESDDAEDETEATSETEYEPIEEESEAPSDTEEEPVEPEITTEATGPPAEEETTTEAATSHSETEAEAPAPEKIDEDGVYTSKDDVALYIHTYGRLPKNFITKKEAQALGWEGGSLEPYAPGMCIGGSYFGNYEGLLPEKDGREYTECDIDTLGKSKRGAKRIVFSNDGLIYYTDDHYESFELLYGEE